MQVSAWKTLLTRSCFIAWHILPAEVMKASLLLSHLRAEWAKRSGTDVTGRCNGGGVLGKRSCCSSSVQKPWVALIMQQPLLLVTYVPPFFILMCFSFIQEVSNGVWGRGNSLASFLSNIIFISCCNSGLSQKQQPKSAGGRVACAKHFHL